MSEIIVKATCPICNKIEELTEEQIQHLADFTFGENVDARGSDLQEALSFRKGKKCKEKQLHAYIFDKEYIQTTTEMSKSDLSDKIEKEQTEKDIQASEQLIIELKKQIEDAETKIPKLKEYVQSVLQKRKDERDIKFKKLTGTTNYNAWLPIQEEQTNEK